MQTPSPKELCEATGISPSYASMIVSDGKHRRIPARSLAIHIFRKTGWRHEILADLTDEQMAMLEQIEPWSPPAEQRAA